MIYLKEIDNTILRPIRDLSHTLTEQQQKVVADNIYSIAQAYLYRDIAWPRAIYFDDTLIGFVMLSLDKGKEEDPEYPSYYLWRFMIGHPYQEKGYGKLVLDELVKKCQEDQIQYLYASCVFSDPMPKTFYLNYGFEDTKEDSDGERVLRLKIDHQKSNR